jgi:hypothetical protein
MTDNNIKNPAHIFNFIEGKYILQNSLWGLPNLFDPATEKWQFTTKSGKGVLHGMETYLHFSGTYINPSFSPEEMVKWTRNPIWKQYGSQKMKEPWKNLEMRFMEECILRHIEAVETWLQKKEEGFKRCNKKHHYRVVIQDGEVVEKDEWTTFIRHDPVRFEVTKEGRLKWLDENGEPYKFATSAKRSHLVRDTPEECWRLETRLTEHEWLREVLSFSPCWYAN